LFSKPRLRRAFCHHPVDKACGNSGSQRILRTVDNRQAHQANQPGPEEERNSPVVSALSSF
jgi:hypothetical protein